MNKKIIFMFLMISFAGCSLIPKTETRELVRAKDIITGTEEQEKLIFTEDNWWSIYDDETLNSLIKLVLSENSDLKIAQLNIEKSNEAVKLAEAQGGLHIDFSGNFKREKTSKNGTVLPPFGGKIFNIGTLGLEAGYDADIFNKFKSLAEEQKYRTEAVKINSKWIEINVAGKIAKLYVYWKYLQEEEKNLTEQKNILLKVKNLYKESIKIGTGTEENLWTLENNIRLLDSIIEENNMNKQITLNNLNILAGNEGSEKIKEILSQNTCSMDTIFAEKVKIPQSINSDIIVSRPDIEYYLMLINAQEEHLKSAKADFYPQFSINGSYGFEAVNFNNVLKKGSILGFIRPSIYLPIFHEGSIKSNYKIAGIDLNIFIEEYNKAVINAYNEIDNELYKTKTLKKSLLNSDMNIINEKKILYENEKRLKIGTKSEYEYLLDKYNFTEKILSNKQEHLKYYVQQLNLINAAGGSYRK